MKKEIRVFIIDICGSIVAISIICFFFTLWLYSFNDISDALKESWAITFSALSALTTIGAAIIAAKLFTDWRVVHNQTTLKDFALATFTTHRKLNIKLVAINDFFTKALQAHKTSHNTYNISKVADDVELSMQEVGDLLLELLHQINYLRKLSDASESNSESQLLDLMHNTLMDYIEVMDISVYRRINNHFTFAVNEKQVKTTFDSLDDDFVSFLKKIIIVEV